MAPWSTLALAALALLCGAHAEWLSLPPGWSFSEDLSFPSHASSLNAYVSDIAPFSVFLPIVNSTSFDAGSKGFSLGFLSFFDSPASTPSRIYFCICLGVRKNGATSQPFLVPVWMLNVTKPLVQQQGQSGLVKLEVDDNEQMWLRDGDGTSVWNMSYIGSMGMMDNGSLVLKDPSNQTVWDSFNNPGDSLLKGQELRLDMELSSINHMYKARMEQGGLLFSLVSPSPLPLVYWVIAAQSNVSDYFNASVNMLSLNASAPINLTRAMLSICNGSNDPYSWLEGDILHVRGSCNVQSSWNLYGESDLVRLDDDGNLRDYHLYQLANSSYTVTSNRQDYRPCHAPKVCGAYGICTVNSSSESIVQHFCRCPSAGDNDSLQSAFRPINASDPSQGCERTETLQCKPNSTQAQLVEIKNVSSIVVLYLFDLTWRENSIPLEDCKAHCSSNCSCTGFLYHTKSSFCLQLGDNTGISNLSLITVSSSDHVAYLKIQPVMQPKPSPSAVEKKHHPNIKLVALISLPLLFTASVGAIVYKMWKQRTDPELELAEQQLLGVMPTLPTRFSYRELNRLTKGFSVRLGLGGFGSVYAGAHPDGMRRVAVKKLELLSHGQKEFLAEIATIGGIRHVNIVHLYGFCLEKQHRLLVYEYMENGSLDKWLFVKEVEQHLPVLSWETRFNVALSTAKGLAFLHEECPKPILHFDVKPENILLDEDFNAKLADFGMSKLVANGRESLVTTVMRGTPGYIAPEWVTHSKVSKKCDVYSFGMVLLELVSGRKNAESQLYNDCPFPKWAAKKSREGKVGDLLDRRLLTTFNNGEEQGNMGVTIENSILEQVTTVVGVALMCVSENPEMRPTMPGVCSMLEGSMALPKDVQGVDIEAPAQFGVAYTSSSSSQVMGSSSFIEAR